jgi:protein-S-isoprenylcysteine O-methyltransferase Ste14
VPSPQPVTRWAILALAGGIFLLVGLPLLGTVPSHAASILGALAVIGGLGTLVWRMRDTPSVDDGPDDGAVV